MLYNSDLIGALKKPRVKRTGTLSRLYLLLLLVVVLPVIFYSGYELSTLSSDEELMASVYRRQLDVILFSINQYSWDAVNAWTGSISRILEGRSPQETESSAAALAGFLSRKPSLRALVCSDTGIVSVIVYQSQNAGRTAPLDREAVAKVFRSQKADISQLSDYLRAEYRKIEPVRFTLPGDTIRHLGLRFIAEGPEGRPVVATLILNEQSFVDELLAPRLQDAAGDEFILAVLRGNDTVFATSPVSSGELKERKDLWLLPSYSLGIRPKGSTVDELVRTRFTRNIILIALLNVVLLAGAWLIYRNLRREVQLVRMRAGFVSTVSHELRTPLSLIRMYAETLEMGRISTEEKKQQYYTTILRESERLTRLVNNVLSFAKMDAGMKQYHFGRTDLNELVGKVLEMFRVQLQAEGFNPVVVSAASLPSINADAEAVSEMIINLLDNAIKYSGGNTYLRVGTSLENQKVVLAIEDHGIGIPPEHREKIFEQFYRVSDGMVHDVKGSGLGLALVRHGMEAHGGSVLVDSIPGKGSTFRLVFPALKE